ncbi:MAG TPA: pitrilysin family protein [Vicinamibacterales bacterium]|nr:pitrilysin family protein [Vicinamibacterales bacterium]
MKRFFAAALIAATGVSTAGAQQQAPKVFPFPYEVVELPNGFRTYLIKAGAPGQIAYVTIVRTGSRDEVEKGRSGFAHFFEHMMFRGTEKYPQYDAETTKMGAFRNASTWADQTAYYIVANSEYLEKIMDIESDRFQNLKYSDADFRTEAGAILGEYQQGAREPQRFLNEKIREAVFQKHTYGHTVIGYEADVRAMPEAYDYSLSFYERFYRPENTVLVIAGDFDFAKAKQLLRKYYGDWKPGYKAPSIEPEPPQTAPRDVTVKYPGRTLPIIAVNYRAPQWNPTDRTAVALEVLGQVAFGSNSDLYRRLVLEQRKVQSLFPSFGLARDPYIVTVQTMVSNPADVKAVEAEILETVKRFQETTVDPKKLADTKSALKYGFLMGMETAQDVAFAVMQSIVSTGRLEPLEDYYRTLDALTPDDIREAARKYLVETGRTTVTMVQEG